MRTFAKYFVLLGLIAPLSAVFAQSVDKTLVPTALVGETNDAAVHYRYPLAKFVPTPGPLMLRDASIASKISVPLSSRLKLKTVTLTLNFTSSIALKPETSVLAVRFNEATLAQIRLDPKSPVGVAKINLPIELARSGYNTITLAVTQHNGDNCEDPEAPELWTEINTADSTLEIDGEYTNTPLRISDLEQVLSPGIGGARGVSVVTPPLKSDAAMIEASTLVAQAIALRGQYEAVDLHPVVIGDNGTWTLDDQIIIGTRDQISGLLGAGEADAITGPYIGLRSLERRQARIVVSGRTPQDVILAARALTFMDIPVADAVNAAIKGIKPVAGTQARTLQPERVYSFAELGMPSATYTGTGTQKFNLYLPMPPDLYAPEQAKVDLLLDLDYGAGMGPGSVINVDVNGKFLHSISLSNENGASYRQYRISVPLRDLVGGPNQIGFGAIMRSVRKDLCAGVSGRHLAMTLFGTSSVQIPEASHVAVQPDLDLMVRTGYPYADATAPTTVWLSDASLIGAGWTFVGRLAQVSGAALPRLQMLIGGEPPKGAAILIGESKALPPRIFAGAVQALGEVNRIPYRSFNGIVGTPAPSLFARLWPLSESPRQSDAPLPTGLVEQTSDLGDNLVLTAARADGTATGTVTVFTGSSRDRIISGMKQLTSAAYWGQAQGDFMLMKNTPDSVVTLRLSPRFQVGSAPPVMNLRFYISQHPWWWLGGIIAVLMALSGMTVWLLARRRPPSA